jgi:hypothetical protein
MLRDAEAKFEPCLRHYEEMMETSAEACWRLSKACGQWAAESRDTGARIAFREMARGWARLAFTEEFTSPAGERIDSQKSEASPAKLLASSLPAPHSEVERDWTNGREKLSLPRRLSAKLWGKSVSR